MNYSEPRNYITNNIKDCKNHTNSLNNKKENASIILGVISITWEIHTFILFLSMVIYRNVQNISNNSEFPIGFILLPTILAVIGVILTITSSNKIKNLGLILNIITIILCVIQFLMITGM